MAGLHGPLPTLRPWPRGQTRTARGRRGSLLLRRIGLSPTTPGRSPGALPNPKANDPLVGQLPWGVPYWAASDGEETHVTASEKSTAPLERRREESARTTEPIA